MASQTSHDLGHGVRVVPGGADGVVVLSESIELVWRAREPDRPGSAVMWRERSFEVIARERWRNGERWILEPWTGEDVMRMISVLDASTVEERSEDQRAEAEAERLGPWLWLASPFLGFAIARWQLAWRDRWGFRKPVSEYFPGWAECCVQPA